MYVLLLGLREGEKPRAEKKRKECTGQDGWVGPRASHAGEKEEKKRGVRMSGVFLWLLPFPSPPSTPTVALFDPRPTQYPGRTIA